MILPPSTACPDWPARLRDGRSLIPPPLYPEAAERALTIFKGLRIVDAGGVTFGESSAPWVFDLVASIFGAYNADTGRREITEWFVLVPKKNAKSTIAAGIMLTALILNWRHSGEFTVIAPSKVVADNVFDPCFDMVRPETDAELDALLHARRHLRQIEHRTTHATLAVLAAESGSVGGSKSIGTLVEELHEFGKRAGAESMLVEALGGLAARPEGFVIYITTQSDEEPAGVFKTKLEYARDVRDGKIHDPRFVPLLFEHPPEMVLNGDCMKVENMAMVNPNLGYSVDEAFFPRAFAQAELEGQSKFQAFMAKHANVQVGLRSRMDQWAGAEWWIRCQDKRPLVFEDLLDRCEVIDAGADGGGLDDLLGLNFTGRERNSRRWLTWSKAYCHASVLLRHKQLAPRLLDLQKTGDLMIVDQMGEDLDDLAHLVLQVETSGLLDKMGCDPAGVGGILDALDAVEIAAEKIVGVRQGWSMTGAIKTTERMLAAGTLLHGGQPLMSYCVSNAKTERRGNAVLITKAVSGVGKIDPLLAMFNAVTLLSLNPEGNGSMDDWLSNLARTAAA